MSPSRPTKSCDDSNGPMLCHLDAEVSNMQTALHDLKTNVENLSKEVSESLKAIGSAPDKAKREEGSGIARSVVEIQESVAGINDKLAKDQEALAIFRTKEISSTELVLKKVQTIGTIVTSISGILGILGVLVAALIWMTKHVPH